MALWNRHYHDRRTRGLTAPPNSRDWRQRWLARNHPFVDGNKPTAFVLSLLFLAANGNQIEVDREDGIATFLALAAGELSEEELADWFRQRLAEA